MKKTKLMLAISLLGLLGGVYHAAAIGTAFTYQGRLADSGSPASGNYDLRFTVWDSAVGGLQVGAAEVLAPVSVSGGLFTVRLDFGPGIFTCPDRWLQIESRVFGGPTYSLINPRQQLTPAPYAITAGSVCATPGAVPDVSLSANVALLNRNPQTFTGRNSFNNNVGIGTATAPAAVLDVFGTRNISGASDGIVNIGDSAGFHVTLDNNEIHARDGGSSSDLYINDFGGTVYVADRAITALSAGNVGIDTQIPAATLDVNGNTIVRGNLSFSDQLDTIQFPATAGANSPMITMFASGTVNADRMVIAHSPLFPNYGLQYQDSSDKFNFLGNGTAVMTVDLADLRVGIGTTTPTQAKLVVNGSVSGTPHPGNVSLLNSGGVIANVSAGTDPVSILASDDIFGAVFIAFSDARIKRIEGRSDAARDLSTLLGLEVTDYTYIDTAVKGTGKQKKLIAQQVEKVYPQAVHRHTDVVPDIYQKAPVKGGWVQLATNLKKGERVRLVGLKKEGVYEVREVAQDKFRTDFAADSDEVFVYGREVNDFRSVDYEAIAMLNVSATQELNRRLEKQAAEIAARDGRIATLEKANQEMRRELAAQKELASHLQAEFATVRKAIARLADKSANTFALNH